MLRLRTSISCYKNVKALLCRDEAEAKVDTALAFYAQDVSHSILGPVIEKNLLLALRLGALTDATANTALKLMRTSNTLVALFDANGHADAVADAESAPSGTNAALDGT